MAGDKVSNLLVDIVEHLAAKEPFSVRGEGVETKTEQKEDEY